VRGICGGTDMAGVFLSASVGGSVHGPESGVGSPQHHDIPSWARSFWFGLVLAPTGDDPLELEHDDHDHDHERAPPPPRETDRGCGRPAGQTAPSSTT
jgi:hypothetical protein